MLQYLFRNLRQRRFRLASRATCDVLIMHDQGKEFLLECIPEHAVTRICSIDREIPLILSLSYVVDVVTSIATGVRAGPAVLRAAIRAWDPLVVLCGETIYDLPGEVSEFFPGKSFIVLSRCLLVPPLLPKKLPIFYSYGYYDKDVLDQEGVVCEEHHPIGSLKAELILKRVGKRQKVFDICFISQYRVSIAERDLAAVPRGLERWFDELLAAYNPANAIAYEFTRRYARKHGATLCVAMAAPQSDTRRQEKERKYFRSLVDTESDVVFIPRTSTSSYEAVLLSKVSLTVDSALGFEALGLGEKVFFFVELPCMRKYLQKQCKSANPIYYSRLPQELKMMSEDFDEFEGKLTRLLGLGELQYQDLVRDAKAYYMNNAASSPPDEYLRKNIEVLLKKRPGVGLPSGGGWLATSSRAQARRRGWPTENLRDKS